MLTGRSSSSEGNASCSNGSTTDSVHEPGITHSAISSNDKECNSNDLLLERAESVPNVPPESKSLGNQNSVLLDQERYLPIANVVRIMKTQMDPQAKLAKDAKECVQECVSEFISFIASEAAEFCHNTKRKTITADDLLTALEATGFDNYAEPMRIFLMKYRQAHKVTGPIHRTHVNYMRPKQFLDDVPIRPLFFDTEQGRRCTETQYVVNGSEVVKNAPLADEWNEQTGTLNTPKEGPPANIFNVRYANDTPKVCPIDESDTVIALEQQQQMQIYVDPTSKQHYAAMETSNGMELYPIMIQDTPVQLENVTSDTDASVNLNDPGISIQSIISVSGSGEFSPRTSTSHIRQQLSPALEVPYKKKK